MGKWSCVAGCPSVKILYTFPHKDTDRERRRKWLDFFGIEDSNSKYLYVCDRHFSHAQKCGSNMKADSVPDLHENNKISVPCITSLSYSMYTQTNTRQCGSVEISEFLDEYRLSCYFCSHTFAIEKYLEFIDHLKVQHFENEQVFKAKNYPYDDHNYTTEYSESPLSESEEKEHVENSEDLHLEAPPLEDKPEEFEFNIHDKPLDIEEAAKLIKLLDETLLNPNYVYTEEDPLSIDNKDDIKTCTNLTTTNSPSTLENNLTATTADSSSINPSANLNSVNIVTVRSTPMRVKSFINRTKGDFRVEPSTTSSVSMDSVAKKVATNSDNVKQALDREQLYTKKVDQQPLQNVKKFESLYLKKPSKEVTTGLFYIKDIESNTVTQKQTSGKSALKRCLKRANTEINDNHISETSELYKTELVFQFTPRHIIVDLLDNIKNCDILWTFHNEPNNEEYSTTIEELCSKMNKKWSLNLTPLQMRRSINRILTYYRYMLPCDKVDIFKDYFLKLLEFLPSLEDEIPYKRCEYCDICYANASEMRKHLVQKHEYMKLPYKCDHCLERFKESDEYELHKSLPHFMKIYGCQHCNKRFNLRQALQRHLKTHESPPLVPPPKLYKCDVCGKDFKTNSELSAHKDYHGEKLFKCHLCEKSFYKKMYLDKHINSHLNKRNFICEVCGKAFLDQPHLNKHSDVHTDRKVTCNICGLKLREVSLPRHLRLCHVACEGTIESTIRRKNYNYRRHINPKYRPPTKRPQRRLKILREYNCKKCNLHFDRLKFLKDHNKEVHFNVKKVECVICKIQVKHKPSLKRHYRDKHKLHPYQAFKLLYEGVDIDTVLKMKIDDSLTEEQIRNNPDLLKDTRDDIVDNIDEAVDNIDNAVDNIDNAVHNIDDDDDDDDDDDVDIIDDAVYSIDGDNVDDDDNFDDGDNVDYGDDVYNIEILYNVTEP